MKKVLKAVFWLGVVAVMVFLNGKTGPWFKPWYEDNHAELIGLREKYEQLSKHAAQLETQYKTEADLRKQIEKTWGKILLDQDAKIKVLSDATFLIGKNVATGKGPDYYFQTRKKTQNLIVDEIRINGPDSPPVGFVVIKSDGTTYKGNYRFEVQVEQIQTVDEDSGRVKVYAKAFYVVKENGLAEKRKPEFKKWKDLKYPLPIVGGTAQVDPVVRERKRFYLWAPRYVFGLNTGISPSGLYYRPMLAVSLAGRGVSKRDLDWRYVQLGIDYDPQLQSPGLNLTPFTLRPLPNTLVNTYIGPGIGWDKDGLNYFLNVSLGF